ncbi:MAG TPA: hypothetical protein VHM70_24885 [Polyangiaceae bacterium]|nr:hypothetical protein [Polyangiaceae bacterium]
MTSSSGPTGGPLETAKFPDQLLARVVTPGDEPRVHGYDVQSDLVHHYDLVALTILYLTGELPEPKAAAAVRAALVFISPISVAHASVHAAVLARLCGSPPSAVFGVAAVGVAEQSRFELDAFSDLFEWLKHPTREYPDAQRCTTDAQRQEAERLRRALPAGYELEILNHAPTCMALTLAILQQAGLRRREQFEAVLALARLPSALAEAFAERAVNFSDYPINLPPIEYRAPDVQTPNDQR